ncbi:MULTISPECIES: LTA synthase family protein [unclassified Bacillus (in: firmicutes)]|uniref:LTA synthase family protein n=1 Tax=unclassified Bacillus (in: firmicutes) TaxID=185979 RepID=UPI0008EF9AE6|nr:MULTISPECIES: LTA synthase family protein [unclassified Bacillus (in: firmicutes)]SFA96254.1 Phosphoglycerol transferase MdoB [Bacillus sp. UNCCL13]SFQ79687.1 Phosphoglycerol transferase MdoB [Bacillus sp. cl95]
MKKIKESKLSLIIVATVLLWLKTYLVYKTSFDIKIENWRQEFILFINPLSFLLFIFGISLFMNDKKRNPYILISSFLVSCILFANVIFYRFFNDFLTIPVLFQTSNMSDLGSSVNELLHFSDFFYFADVALLAMIIKVKPKSIKFDQFTRVNRRVYVLASIALAFFNLGLAEAERPQLLTRTFDREMLVKNIGTYNYHIYDAFLQSKSSAQRALADGSELADIDNYIRANYTPPNPKMFGIAKGKNVIMISMESTQNFVINRSINGQEITPFLNDFIKESYYFENFYHQTGQGKTSDSEFIVENSLYPLSRGAVFFTHSGNEFQATPEILNENGYYTASLHANNKSFWNRDIMYKSLGYQRFYSMNDYEITAENSIGWGLEDKEFFEQSIEHLKNMPKPFYSKFITLTNHFPFELNEEDRLIDPFTSDDKTVNNYLPTVRYTDEALKYFVQRLKDEGLYENSIIIIYGDHYGISENHHKAMGDLLGKEIDRFESTQLQRVPLIIHIPGQKGKKIATVSGQMDLKPTILHLLGIDTKKNMDFGSDLFSQDKKELTVLRDGSFITADYLYTRETCYDKSSGQPIEVNYCEPYMDTAKKELDYSDKIIYGDLLRFYNDLPLQK